MPCPECGAPHALALLVGVVCANYQCDLFVEDHWYDLTYFQRTEVTEFVFSDTLL